MPNGVTEYWSTGVLEYWSTGVLGYWGIGVLGYWGIGVLGSVGIAPRDRGLEMPNRFSSARSVIFIAIVSESGDSSVIGMAARKHTVRL